MTAKSYPLSWPESWPRTSQQREGRYHFKSRGDDGRTRSTTIEEAQTKLHRELKTLKASYVVVSSNMPVRRDGMMGSTNFIPEDTGVALYFTYKGRQMAMACDRFNTVAANLRSLGLAVEAMRQLERHGGGAMMDRAFSGFTAIAPPPKPERPWRDVLDYPASWPLSEKRIDFVWREKAKDLHPDRGGSNKEMADLNRAREEALKECRS